MIRKDRNSVGGGVALYVHKSVDFKRCDESNLMLKQSQQKLKLEIIDHF